MHGSLEVQPPGGRRPPSFSLHKIDGFGQRWGKQRWRTWTVTETSIGSPVRPTMPFGTVLSESGAACNWNENAHEFRLTPWNNDPVSDSSGEPFYLRRRNKDLLVAHAAAELRSDALRSAEWCQVFKFQFLCLLGP